MYGSVNGAGSNTNRITGMASGLDTDTMVKQALAGYSAKIDKVKANKQVDTWRTEGYREITSSLKTFYSTYFDTISKTSLKSESSFSGFTTSYGATTSSNYVTVTAGKSAEAGAYSITNLIAAKAATLSGKDASRAIAGTAIDTTALKSISSANNKLSITLNGITKNIALDTDGTVTTVAGLQEKLQQKIDSAFGKNRIVIGLNSNSDGISFTPKDTDTFSIDPNGTANTVLKLVSSNLSNKIDLNEKISNLTNSLSTALITGTENTIEFTINGTSFSFNSDEKSMQDIMDEVNSNTTINATMKYDTTTNSFKIKSSSTGAADSVVVEDKTGNLLKAIGIEETSAIGIDASVTVSDGTTTKTITRSSNVFTYDGLTYNIKQDFTAGKDATTGIVTDPIGVTLGADTQKSYDYIKGFIDKYNELIEKINEKLVEKKNGAYAPLTDEQKDAMTDEQIKSWETKAKAGLFRNDSILSGIVSKLRNTLYDAVEGTGLSLSAIGITTSSDYTQRGKLSINETKLKEALATKSEEIIELFTKSSDKSYYETLDSTTVRSERYKESGIAHRFSDIIQDAIRTNTDGMGYKGSLLEKAGITGDRSEFTNLLYKEMESFDKTIYEMNNKLSSKENALYSKFAAMESALNRLNSQQSSLAQMLGNNSQ